LQIRAGISPPYQALADTRHQIWLADAADWTVKVTAK
jgi:hypothetical protein